MKSTIVVILAILVVTTLTFYAVSKGQNGATLMTSFTIIGGLAGYKVGNPNGKVK